MEARRPLGIPSLPCGCCSQPLSHTASTSYPQAGPDEEGAKKHRVGTQDGVSQHPIAKSVWMGNTGDRMLQKSHILFATELGLRVSCRLSRLVFFLEVG